MTVTKDYETGLLLGELFTFDTVRMAERKVHLNKTALPPSDITLLNNDPDVRFTYWLLVQVLHPTRHNIGHFGDVLPSQSLNQY